jgi:hypothetical protein
VADRSQDDRNKDDRNINAPDYHTQPQDAFVKHVSYGPLFCAVPGRTVEQACFWGSNLSARCGD